MSRDVKRDGMGSLEVRFPFDRALVDRIKSLPSRRWNAADRFWSVPEHDVVLLVDLLHAERFRFDTATRELYRQSGGEAELDEPAGVASPAGAQPGLFDTEPGGQRSAEDAYTVSRLNERVREVIEEAFPAPLWLIGEISGFNRSAHKRHVSFKLIEIEAGGRTVSSVDATLFDQSRRTIERALDRAGRPFRLEDEITVRVKVRIELYVPWGSYRVIVEELDVNYTLGEAARRREEIVRRLTEQGLLEANRSLPLPAWPLRVGLVTSLGSDAYNDVLRTLHESGFAFRVTAHGARVQGHATEPSLLNALDWFRERAERFDVVLICRGGGSRTDLAWFDSELLGRAVALFPLPIVVGIGHENDHSVLDAVARRCKTPTAAASLLAETVRENLARLEELGLRALEAAARCVAEQGRRGVERSRRLALAARGLLRQERTQLEHRRELLARATGALLVSGAEQLSRLGREIPRAALLHFTRQRLLLDGARRAVGQSAGRRIAEGGRTIAELARRLRPQAARVLVQAGERTEARARRLELVDPRRVLDRGYAILRLSEGGVLTDATRAPAGTGLEAKLRHGTLRLRSEGPGTSGPGGD